jgi:hypothetical protein
MGGIVKEMDTMSSHPAFSKKSQEIEVIRFLPLKRKILRVITCFVQGDPDAAGERGAPQAQDQVVETEGRTQL